MREVETFAGAGVQDPVPHDKRLGREHRQHFLFDCAIAEGLTREMLKIYRSRPR